MEDILLFIHQLAVILWIGAVIGEGFFANQGKKGEEQALEGLLGKMKMVSLASRGAGGLITLTGLALVFIIGYDFTELWIIVKLLVVVSTIAIGALLMVKLIRKLTNPAQMQR